MYKKIKLEEIEEKEGIRTQSNDEHLSELALSISELGLLQPIVALKKGEDKYKVIIGHRRVKASKKAKLTKIPAIVLDKKDFEESLLELTENLQREALHPFDEAMAIISIKKKTDLSDTGIAMKIGKSRTYVVKMASLSKLFPYLEKYPSLYALPKRLLFYLAGAKPEKIEERIKEILSLWRKRHRKQNYKFNNIEMKIQENIEGFEPKESDLQSLSELLSELLGDAELEIIIKPKKKRGF